MSAVYTIPYCCSCHEFQAIHKPWITLIMSFYNDTFDSTILYVLYFVFSQEKYEKELKDTRARELMYAEEAAILDKV